MTTSEDRIQGLLAKVEPPDNQRRCRALLADHGERMRQAQGSSHNHQAWPGGYLDHIAEVMSLAVIYHGALAGYLGRQLPFSLSDALVVLFLHDVEKPWKGEVDLSTKEKKRAFRALIVRDYGIDLTPSHLNALRYVEGEGDDYQPGKRVMGELAAFCHVCDVTSARIWHDQPARSGGRHDP